MLSNKELQDYFVRTKLSPQAIKKIHQIRSEDPVRRVFSGPNNVACHYASKKMGLTIQAESHSNELAALVGWEFDDHTYEMYDQPQQVKLSYIGKNGRRTTHLSTPDYFLLQEWFYGWVECKTEEELQKSLDSGSQRFIRDENGKWHCPAGEAYAANFGLKFAVRSSQENNYTYIRNLEFLSDYFDVECSQLKQSQIDTVMESIKDCSFVDLKSLIDGGLDADVIYKMLADQLLYFDINHELLANPDSTIIYRNKQAADSFKAHVKSNKGSVALPSTILNIAVGEQFLWDGVPWKILNAGDTEIHAEDATNTIVSLKKCVLEQLIKDGMIVGIPDDKFPEQHLAEELLRKASSEDHQHALYRYQNLFPEDGAVVTAHPRTIRKWRKKYREAEETLGSGYLGLLPNLHLQGNFLRKIDDKVISIMDAVIDELYLQPGGPSKTSCWGEVRLRCEDGGFISPSEKTFLAQIARRSQNEIKEIREGEKAAYSQSEFVWFLEQTTPRHGDRPFEIGHIDHTELDLQLVGSRFGENLHKAWLTILIDAYTRMILAWVLTFEKPSYRSCMLVIRECVKRHGRIPRYLVLDQGAEFHGTYMDCLIARLKSHKKIRPASKPRNGSVIERFFGVNNQTFIHNLRGNNLGLQNPRSLSKSHDPRALAVWTLPQFSQAFEGYLTQVYSKMENAGLGVSPETAMAVGLKMTGARNHICIPYTRDFIIMCLPTTPKGTAKVDPGRGVKIGYIYYWAPEFRNPKYAKTQVEVRYDPFNMAVAMVWLKDHWVDCVSEMSTEFQGRTEKEIKNATQELRAKFSRSHQRRSINATIIAAYLRETTNTEAGLLAQQKKLDSEAASSMQVLTVNIDKQFPVTSTTPHKNVWEGLTIKMLGEFSHE